MKKRDNKKSPAMPKSDNDEMQFYIEMASDRTDYTKRIEAIAGLILLSLFFIVYLPLICRLL